MALELRSFDSPLIKRFVDEDSNYSLYSAAHDKSPTPVFDFNGAELQKRRTRARRRRKSLANNLEPSDTESEPEQESQLHPPQYLNISKLSLLLFIK